MKNPKDKVIMWSESTFDADAYMEGSKSKGKNPYKPQTNKWYNWNKGKNQH